MTNTNYQKQTTSQANNPAKHYQPTYKVVNSKDINVCNIWVDRILANKTDTYASEKYDNLTAIRQWKDGYWQLINPEDGKASAFKWLKTTYPNYANPENASKCWRSAELYLRSTQTLPEKKNRDDIIVLPFHDKYLHITKDKVMVNSPSKAFYMRYVIPYNYKSHTYKKQEITEDSLFGRFLNSSIPDKQTQKLIQEQCAMTFMSGDKNQIATWWFGPGRAGKGTMVKILSKFHSNPVAISLHKLNDTHALTKLAYASMVIVDEVAKKRWDEETWKTLISGNDITANPKHKNEFTFRCRATWIISSNNPPFITDDTTGTSRRILPVEWTRSIPIEDRIMDLDKRIFDEEADIVISWLVEGIQRILKRGGAIMPESERPEAVRRTFRDMTYDNDSLGAWFQADKVKYSKGFAKTKDAVYMAYEAFCEADHRVAVAKNVFWRLLYNRQDCKQIKQSQVKKVINGKRAYCVDMEWSSAPERVIPDRVDASFFEDG